MSDYTKITDFTVKDSLTSGDPSKLVLGSEIDAELDAIAAAIATKTDGNGSVTDGDKGDITVTDSGLTWYNKSISAVVDLAGLQSAQSGTTEYYLGAAGDVGPSDYMAAYSTIDIEYLARLYNNTGVSRTFTAKTYYRNNVAAYATVGAGAELAIEVPTGHYILLHTLLRLVYVTSTSCLAIVQYDPLPYIGGSASSTVRSAFVTTLSDVDWLGASAHMGGKVSLTASFNSASLTQQCLWQRTYHHRAA